MHSAVFPILLVFSDLHLPKSQCTKARKDFESVVQEGYRHLPADTSNMRLEFGEQSLDLVRFAFRAGIRIEENPAHGVRLPARQPKGVVFLPRPEQVARILKQLPEPSYTLMLLLVGTGLWAKPSGCAGKILI